MFTDIAVHSVEPHFFNGRIVCTEVPRKLFFFFVLSRPPPFPLTNDRAADEGGFSFSIVRPGQIKGEPFASYSANGGSSTPAGTEGPSGKAPKRMVSLRQGDEEAGDVNPSSVAAVFTQVGGRVLRWRFLLLRGIIHSK